MVQVPLFLLWLMGDVTWIRVQGVRYGYGSECATLKSS